PTDEARGKELYERHCFACHGAGARGDGPATAAFRDPVPPARDFEVSGKVIDVVLQGRQLMPAFGDTFDRADAKRVLQHMKKLPDEPTPPPGAKTKTPPREPIAED
ncbi:MAG: cytochrome c, partial [Myxococcota bacterium]